MPTRTTTPSAAFSIAARCRASDPAGGGEVTQGGSERGRRCGAIGQSLAGSSRGGCLVAIALGFIGAAAGMLLARSLDLPPLLVVETGGKGFPIVWSIVGSALFVAVLSLLTRRR